MLFTAKQPPHRTAERDFGCEAPGPPICRKFTRKGAPVPEKTLLEIRCPLGAAKPTRPPDFFTAKRESRLRRPEFAAAKRESRPRRPDFFTAKRESRPRRPEFATAKRESRPRRPEFATAKRESRPCRPDFFTAKCESRPRRSPLPGRGFSGHAAGRNGALPYNARKSQFLRNGDVWATESLFLFAVLWLAFLPGQSETGVAGGGKARRPETPAAPRRPAQRPRPAPGFCAASANARPGDPAPVRLLEKALWVPPTTEPFRPAPSGKPERKKERRNPG